MIESLRDYEKDKLEESLIYGGSKKIYREGKGVCKKRVESGYLDLMHNTTIL